ncbi:MAG: hypothetical protein ACI4F7_08285 [Acutalibacteraceae bacterium]
MNTSKEFSFDTILPVLRTPVALILLSPINLVKYLPIIGYLRKITLFILSILTEESDEVIAAPVMVSGFKQIERSYLPVELTGQKNGIPKQQSQRKLLEVSDRTT